MLIEIDEERLGRLFPAYLILDRAFLIHALGPTLKERVGCGEVATNLNDHFEWLGDRTPNLARLAREGSVVHLRTRVGSIILHGSVLPEGDRFILALSCVPAALTLTGERQRITDFAPSDPAIPALLLTAMHRALLEEAHSNAEELVRERQHSQHLLARISRVSGFMAHDFNNLLSILHMNVRRLSTAGILNEQQQRLQNINMEIIARGTDLSRALTTLALQRHDSAEVISVDALIEEHLPMFASALGSNLHLETALGAADQMIEISRPGLINCLINLLVNAREATPTGGRVVIATSAGPARLLSRRSAAEKVVKIDVTDTGSGMDGATLDRAFEVLYSTKPHGRGLGLASVAELVKEFGGKTAIHSQPGLGCTVRMEFPVSASPVSGYQTEQRLANVDDMDAQERKIVVLEDEPYALEALCEALESGGFRVEGTAFPAEAIAILEADPHSILLTDVVMPGQSGIELAEQVAVRWPDIPIILMSGYTPNSKNLLPGWLFIQKPLDLSQLRTSIGNAQTSGRKPKGPDLPLTE